MRLIEFTGCHTLQYLADHINLADRNKNEITFQENGKLGKPANAWLSIFPVAKEEKCFINTQISR